MSRRWKVEVTSMFPAVSAAALAGRGYHLGHRPRRDAESVAALDPRKPAVGRLAPPEQIRKREE